MSLRSGGSGLLRRAILQLEATPTAELPAFLCPGLLTFSPSRTNKYLQPRRFHSTPKHNECLPPVASNTATFLKPSKILPVNKLPLQCSGCGALTQTLDKDEPGFFDLKRKSVKQYLVGTSEAGPSKEAEVFEQSIKLAKESDPLFAETIGLEPLASKQSTYFSESRYPDPG